MSTATEKWVSIVLMGTLLASGMALFAVVPAADAGVGAGSSETHGQGAQTGEIQEAESQGGVVQQAASEKPAIATSMEDLEARMAKIDPALRGAARTGGVASQEIVVVTSDVGELGSLVRQYDYSGIVGTNAGPSQTPVPIVLRVPSSALLSIAALDGVQAMYSYSAPTIDMEDDPALMALERRPELEASEPVWQGKLSPGDEVAGVAGPPSPEGQGGNDPTPWDFPGSLAYNEAQAAWALGFDGTGVNVALHDTGVDFVHPDLQGTFARFDVAGVNPVVLAQKPYLSSYDGWPLAFDPLSMGAFLNSGGDLAATGVTSYLDTSTALPGEPGPFNATTIVNYTRDSPLVDNSASVFGLAVNDDPLIYPFPDIFWSSPLVVVVPIVVPAGTVMMNIAVDWSCVGDDLDAALFFDANDDGIPDASELVAWQDTATGACPETFQPISSPSVGTYLVTILGYATLNPTMADVLVDQVSIAMQVATYNVTGITSMSNEYHIGQLPDSSLASTYFMQPAVLVVDSTTPGAYDTYYADLDNDFDFTDEKAATKGDELSYQDVNGDGYADISGGMLYFISSGSSVVGEIVVPTAAGGETNASLANGNVTVPNHISVFRNAMAWDSAVVTAEAVPITTDGTDYYASVASGNVWPGTLVLTGTNMPVPDQLVFTAATGGEAGFSMPHANLDDLTGLYRVRTDTGWYADPIMWLTDGTDYTVNLGTGQVTFDPALVSGPNPFLKNIADDEFYAFYNYSEVMTVDVDYTVEDLATGNVSLTFPPNVGSAISADYTYDTYVLDYVAGLLTFTNPLTAGVTITADYQYSTIPIPYSDVYAARHGIANWYPGNGDMVAIMEGYEGSHGTMTASQIVSQSVAQGGQAGGTAPGAKIIPIITGRGSAILDVFDSWFFAVEGYDGVANSGDDAQIISNSWGGGGLPGFAFQDLFADWIVMNYSQGQTIMVFSSGNSGPGYGSLGYPNSPALAMVSGAQHFFYRVLPSQLSRSYDGGPNPMGGQTWYGASVGPTYAGHFGVDMTAEASFAVTAIPLNGCISGGTNMGLCDGTFDGYGALDFVSGTSFSAPTASGIFALAYQAYENSTGAFPDAATVKAIVMSGARDNDNNGLVQGAGYVNGLQSVQIANGLGGSYVEPFSWIPGDWRGTTYEIGPRVMLPGTSQDQVFTVTNPGPTADSFSISGEMIQRFDSYSESYNPNTFPQPAGIYGPSSMFYILNDTGLYDWYTGGLLQSINPASWNTADFLRVSGSVPLQDWNGLHVLEVHRYTPGIVNDDWRGHTDEVRAVDISPDGMLMATAGADGLIFVVDTMTSEIVWEFVHPGDVSPSGGFNNFDVKFSSNGVWLAASLGGTNISLWDVTTGLPVNTIVAPSDVNAIDISPNGTWMVAGQDDANVTIWELPTGTLMGIWNQTDAGPVNDVDFSPNGTWVASADYGWWEVDLWNVTTLAQEDFFDVDPSFNLGYPTSVEFNPANGLEVAYSWKYGWYLRSLGLPAGPLGAPNAAPDIGIYDIGLGTYTGWMAGHDDVVMDISWSADGTMIASGSGLRPDLGGDDNTVKVWDATTNDTMLENVQRFFDFVAKVQFDPTDNCRIGAADFEGVGQIVDICDTQFLPYTTAIAIADGFDMGLWYERNREVTSFASLGTNVDSVRVSDPAANNPDGIIIWSRSLAAGDRVMNISIEFFQKTSWSWVSTPANVNVPAGSSANFTATMTVPADAGVGLHEGALYLRNPSYEDIVIPTMVHVPATSARFSFGGDRVSEPTLYDNNRMSPAQKHFFYMDVPDSFALADGARMLIDMDTDGGDSYANIRHFQQTDQPSFPSYLPETPTFPAPRYGFGMEETDAGAQGVFSKTTDWQGNGAGLIKGLSVDAGFGLVTVDTADVDGWSYYEWIDGEAGIMRFNPFPVDVSSNSVQGSTSVDLVSNIPWAPNPDPFSEFYGKAAGVLAAGEEKYKENDIPIFFDPAVNDYSNGDITFTELLALAAYQRIEQVDSSVVIFDVHIMGQADAPDLDLGVFFDANADGIADPGEWVAQDADADADEQVVLLLPTPGQYIVTVVGFTVNAAPGHFDLEITRLKVGAAPFALENVPSIINADEAAVMSLTWDLDPATPDGVVKAAFFVSPGNAPLAFVILVPVNLNLDTDEPTVADPSPANGALVSDSNTPIVAGLYDTAGNELDRATARIWLDGSEVTDRATISVPFDGGFPIGTVTYVPPMPLADGPHSVRVEVADMAGNLGFLEWAFAIDSNAPSVEILTPSDGLITSTSTVTVSGITESGATVSVAGGTPMTAPMDGSFSSAYVLIEGANVISVMATDAAGNQRTASVTVTLDTRAPAISAVASSAGPLTNGDSTTLSGTVSPDARLWVNGEETGVNADGSWTATVTLNEGLNVIDIAAVDAAGNSDGASVNVTRDTAAPAITLGTFPTLIQAKEDCDVSGARTEDVEGGYVCHLTVSGTVDDSDAQIFINGNLIGSGGTFSKEFPLNYGPNEFTVTAEDEAGNVHGVDVAVAFTPQAVQVKQVYTSVILIALAVVLLIIGLVIGMLLRGKPGVPEEMPPEEEFMEEEEMPAPPEEEEIVEEDEDLFELEELEEEEAPPPPAEEPADEPALEEEGEEL